MTSLSTKRFYILTFQLFTQLTITVHVFTPFLSFTFSVKLVEAKDDCVIIIDSLSSFPYFPQVKSLLMAMLN